MDGMAEMIAGVAQPGRVVWIGLRLDSLFQNCNREVTRCQMAV
jgi:hypothetical protein